MADQWAEVDQRERTRTMTESSWVQPWKWRWKGRHRWHRLAIGPFCLSIWPGGGGRRWYVSHSWHFRNATGEMRHVPSFRRWLRAPRG